MMSPDATILWRFGWFALNATLVYTWLLMLLLVVGSWAITRRLSIDEKISRWQNLLEVLVSGLRQQIAEVSRQAPDPYLPFVGTLFVFIAAANLLGVIPGYTPPTASLSTTTALAITVLVAVPVFGIAREGVGAYLKHYVRPSVFMLPFNVIGEISRTISLSVRLYGNIMSGTVIAALLLSLVPFFVPVVVRLFGLLIGMIQAYIFAVLAMVYIASATIAHHRSGGAGRSRDGDGGASTTGDQHG